MLKEIVFKEEYLGEKIQPGNRGVVFTVVYQNQQRTLTEAEVEGAHQKVLASLVQRLGATVR